MIGQTQSNPPTNLRGSVQGSTGSLQWDKPIYGHTLQYTNQTQTTGTGADNIAQTPATGGTRHYGFMIPQADLASLNGFEIYQVSYYMAGNGQNSPRFHFIMGASSTRTAYTRTGQNDQLNVATLATPHPLDNTGNFYFTVECTGQILQTRNFIRYDTQGSTNSISGQTAIYSTNGTSNWNNAHSGGRTLCMWVDLIDPTIGTSTIYRLYADGAMVVNNITTETYNLGALVAPTTYTVTAEATDASYTESVHSNAVMLEPITDTPTNFTASYSYETFMVNTSWEFDVPPSTFNTLIFDEDFETSAAVKGWTTVDRDGDCGTTNYCDWTQLSGAGRGSSMLSYSWDNDEDVLVPLNPDNWLISPKITGLNGPTTLTFWRRSAAATYGSEKYSVLVSTTGTNVGSGANLGDFTAVYTETIPGTVAGVDWTMRTVDLSAYSGQEIYIAFRHWDCTDQFFLAIDDIQVITNVNTTDPWYNYFFRIYCNNAVVGTTSEKSFDHSPLTDGTLEYKVAVVSHGGTHESNPSNAVNVAILLPTTPCLPPYEPEAEENSGNVIITWEDPSSAEMIVHRHGTSEVPLFSNEGIRWAMAIGWDPEDMRFWGPTIELRAIRYYIEGTAARVGVSAWNNANATGYPTGSVHYTNIASGPNITDGGWKEFRLPAPVTVNINNPFFVGYQFPSAAGCLTQYDGGTAPTKDLRSNLFLYDTSTPNATTQMNPNTTLLENQGIMGNWLVEAVFGWPTSKGEPVKPEIIVNNKGEFRMYGGDEKYTFDIVPETIKEHILFDRVLDYEITEPIEVKSSETRAHAGFNVYRNDVLLTPSPISTYTFQEPIPGVGVFNYQVSVLYTDGCLERFTEPMTLEFGNVLITNLAAVVENKGIRLTWTAPDKPVGDFTGYNIYYSNPLYSGSFSDIHTETIWMPLNPGTYQFEVCATYFGNEAGRANVSCNLPDEGFEYPTNFVANQVWGTTDVFLTWEEPSYPEIETYTWSDGVYAGSIGYGSVTNDGAIAHKYDLQVLGMEQFDRVDGIGIYISNSTGSTGQQFTNQKVTIFLSQVDGDAILAQKDFATSEVQWNEYAVYNFDTPITIDPALPLYVGYITYQTNGYPWTYSATSTSDRNLGFLVNDFDGTGFYNLADYSSLDGIWNIAVYLSRDNSPAPIPLSYNLNPLSKGNDILSEIKGDGSQFEIASLRSGAKAIPTGYELYRNQTLLSTLAGNLFEYTHVSAPINLNEYWLSAVYPTGQSRYAQTSVNVIPVTTGCPGSTLTAAQVPGPFVNLTWTENTRYAFVYRNGALIASLDNATSYNDFPPYGSNTYYVNTVTIDNCLQQTNTETVTFVQPQALLGGTITNSDNDPVVGAIITFDDGAGGSISETTNSLGTYTINDMLYGDYTVTITAFGYVTVVENFHMPEINTVYDKELVFKLIDVTGIVTGKDNVPLSPVVITFTNNVLGSKIYSTTSLAGGAYSINNVIEGNYTVEATFAGYFNYEEIAMITEVNDVYDIEMSILTYPVSGTVYSDDTPPNPVSGVAVNLTSGTLVYNVITENDGTYVANVEPGTYNLTASKPGFTNGVSNGVVVSTAPVENVDITITRNFFNFISVNVTEDVLNAPIEDAVVTFSKTDESYIVYTATTDNMGDVMFMQLPEGEFLLSVEADGYWPHFEIVEIDDNMLQFLVELEEDPNAYGWVSGLVTDGTAPIANATITFTNTLDATIEYTVTSNATGNYTQRVIVGDYDYAASAYGCNNFTSTASVSVQPDLTTTVPPIVLTRIEVTLTVNVLPVGSGTTTGQGTYNMGATAEVEATPQTGYNFVNWTKEGTIVGTSTAYSFTIEENTTLVANFALVDYLITATASPAGSGSVLGSGDYAHGATATLTAVPTANYHIVNWTESGTEVHGDNLVYSFTVTGPRTLIANFALDTYTIQVSADPAEGGSVTGGGTFDWGTTQTVVATPSANYVFVNWTENQSQVSTDLSYTFTLEADRNLVAHFALETYTVELSALPTAGGTPTQSGNGTYEHGTSVTINANPAESYNFVKWTEGGADISTDLAYTFTITADRDFVANYAIKTYVVTVIAGTGGTVSGGGTFDHGSNATVEATAEPGYEFENWTNTNGDVVSTNSSYTFAVTADITLTANFEWIGIIGTEMADFTLYPNPATDKVTVVSTTKGNANIEIFNSIGSLVEKVETKDSKNVIDVSTLPSGIYTIRLTNERGSSTLKFVKE